MTKKQKKNLKRIIIASILFLIIFISDLILEKINGRGLIGITNSKLSFLIPFILYFSIYLYIGNKTILKAFKNIINGEVLDENFLMVLSTIGAFSLGLFTSIKSINDPSIKIEGFDEGCAVLLFYEIGEWFQSYSITKSRKSIKDLLDLSDAKVTVIENNIEIVKDPNEIKVNDIILVKPGERVLLDGIIINGNSTIDTKSLTGESLPKDIKEGDSILSGVINLTESIKIKVLKEYNDSTVKRIMDLIENATNNKTKTENFINKFSRYYTVVVVILALFLAIIPPLLIGIIKGDYSHFLDFIYSSLSFLVVSCPCALVVSVPLTFFLSIGRASKYGILIKGSTYLEMINRLGSAVFDKTGTLTKGNFKVYNVIPEKNRNEILYYASLAEKDSLHPIALAIKNETNISINKDVSIINISGKGVIAKESSNQILVGNDKLMEEYHISFEKVLSDSTVIYCALNSKYLGSIEIRDEIKDDSKEVIDSLNKDNIQTVMLTGDNPLTAVRIKNELNISTYVPSLLPENKATELEKIMNNNKKGSYTLYVGDGINDALVLLKSDIGISMGKLGVDAAIEASDIVFTDDNIKSLITLRTLAKKTMRIVKENIIFILLIKFLILFFAMLVPLIEDLIALNIKIMWISVFGDVGVLILAILNSLRITKIKLDDSKR